MFVFFIIMLTISLSVNGWTQSAKEALPDSAMKMVTINIPTIQCGMCVKTVTKALQLVDGVIETSVDRKAKTATVKYNTLKLNLVDLENAVAKSGYDANEVKRDKDAYDNLDGCCR
jgi:periplasmic mercuric ion binding protein